MNKKQLKNKQSVNEYKSNKNFVLIQFLVSSQRVTTQYTAYTKKVTNENPPTIQRVHRGSL